MRWSTRVLFQCFFIIGSLHSFGQETTSNIEIYGFIMADAGYNFNSIDPDWFDVMRPTKLPKYKNEFGPGGNVYFSVRQTRFGVKSSGQTRWGELKTRFEFDLFGFGKDAGQTTIHLINAYGEIGKIGVGQTSSVFMDLDVFPVTLDYWGPLTRVFNFNVQLRYTPIQKENEKLAFALERPGARADGGEFAEQIELNNVTPDFDFPNLTAHYRRETNWGHFQVSGVAKFMKWKDLDTLQYDLSGKAFGWGLNFNANLRASGRLRIKFQGLFGKGFQNYIADASEDVGLKNNPGNSSQPVKGVALPVWGFFGFLEILWTAKMQSSIGYSMESGDNSNLQSANAFKKGQYFLVNLRYYPAGNVMMGIEYQYGHRHNYSDGFASYANKVQASVKYNFSSKSRQND
jgi:hypothetical protein